MSTDPTTTEPAVSPRRLCAHANGDAPMHWLEPGERCTAEPPTTEPTAPTPYDWVRDQTRVHVTWGTGTGTQAEGVVVAYCAHPTLVIRRDDGVREHVALASGAKVTELLAAPTDAAPAAPAPAVEWAADAVVAILYTADDGPAMIAEVRAVLAALVRAAEQRGAERVAAFCDEMLRSGADRIHDAAYEQIARVARGSR
jgi:hypothetical protein